MPKKIDLSSVELEDSFSKEKTGKTKKKKKVVGSSDTKPKKVTKKSQEISGEKITRALKRNAKKRVIEEDEAYLRKRLKEQAKKMGGWDKDENAVRVKSKKDAAMEQAEAPKKKKKKHGKPVLDLTPPSAEKTLDLAVKETIVSAAARAKAKKKLKATESSIILPDKPSLLKPKKKKLIRLSKLDVDSILNFNLEMERDESNPFAVGRKDEDEDLGQLIKKALKSHAPVPDDLKVDDRDIPKAKNFFEFATSKRFMAQKPYARQLEIAIKLLGEYNPDETNLEWFNAVPPNASYDDFLENVQLLEHGKCPKTGVTKSELVRQKKLNLYTELAASLGQRSGKSFLASLLAAYQTHGLLKLQKPSAAFDLAKGGTTFHGTFVSLTFKQAKENLYDPLFGMMMESPWFQEYHKMLDYYGTKYGEELYKFKDTFFSYRPRDFILYPSGPDKRVLRGRTRYIAAIDELGWIMTAAGLGDKESKSLKYNADEIHKALRNSLRTAVSGWKSLVKDGFNTIIPPLMINISSPSSKYDLITRLVEMSKESKSIIGFNCATWEFNPKISFEDLADDFREDPEKAWRDFGAVPPMSSATFISNVENFREVVDKNIKNSFSIETAEIKSKKLKKTFTSGRVIQHWMDPSCPKALCLDAGETDNSFAIAMGHNILVEDEFIPVIDGMGEVFPSREAPVNFTYVEKDVLIPLIKNNGVTHVFADRWQSTKLLSDLEDKCGVITERYSLKYNDFVSFRDDLYVGGFVMPKPEMLADDIVTMGAKNYPSGFHNKPLAHFVFQALTVRDMGKKGVQKGEHSTDDLFRATVLLHKFLIDPEYRHLFEGSIMRRKDRALGALRSMQSGPVHATASGSSVGAVISQRHAMAVSRPGQPKIFSRIR